MIQIRMVVVLANKPGLDPLDWVPKEYRPGRPLRSLANGFFPIELNVVGDKDFDDKLVIFYEAIEYYINTKRFLKNPLYFTHTEFACRPVSKGDIRGVSVAILHNPRLLDFRNQLTDIEIRPESLGVEVRSSNQQTSGDAEAVETAKLPAVPEAAEKESAPTLETLVFAFRRFAEANPERVEEATKMISEIGGEYWPHNPLHTITAQEAEKLTGLSRARILQLANDERWKGMAEFRDGQWFFSGTGLARYMREGRGKTGRPPKSKKKPPRR